MTIVVTLQVGDGVVMSSDSATTLSSGDGQVINVYEHANKMLNLRKGLPIGLVTWGLRTYISVMPEDLPDGDALAAAVGVRRALA